MLLFSFRKGRWTRRCSHAFVHIKERTIDEQMFTCVCPLSRLREGRWTRSCFLCFCSHGRGHLHINVSRLRGGLGRRSPVSVQVGEKTFDKGSEQDNQ
jgi:hypothetical protein